MNRLLLSLLVAFAATLPALAADDHAPKHGGVVVDTKAGDLELVAKAGLNSHPRQRPWQADEAHQRNWQGDGFQRQ